MLLVCRSWSSVGIVYREYTAMLTRFESVVLNSNYIQGVHDKIFPLEIAIKE